MDAQQLKQDVRAGRISLDRLVELIRMMQRQLERAREELDRAQAELAEAYRRMEVLERKLGRSSGSRPAESYSVEAEEKRRRKGHRRKKGRSGGRRPKAEKLALAERVEEVFPAGAAKEACRLSRTPFGGGACGPGGLPGVSGAE